MASQKELEHDVKMNERIYCVCTSYAHHVTDLSHRRLRVEQEVAERSLENPSELGQEARVVGDGPGGGGGGPLPPLDDPL